MRVYDRLMIIEMDSYTVASRSVKRGGKKVGKKRARSKKGKRKRRSR
jgi:hypothetical protein